MHTLGLPALTVPPGRNHGGQPALPLRMRPPGSSMLKCHDLHLTRGCHIRSCGLSDLSPSNTAALRFLSDKCSSLGLTKMNVLVYKSQLSTFLGEPMDLDQKQGIYQVGSPTLPLGHRLWGGGRKAKSSAPAKNRSHKSLSVGTVRSGSFCHNQLRVNQVLEGSGSTVYIRHHSQ